MKILVATDGSSSSESIIREASSRTWPPGTTFTVVTVVDPFFFSSAPRLLEEAGEKAVQALTEQARPIADAGWVVHHEILLDSARHALPRYAATMQTDLVLVGSHGRGTVGRLLLGSTAQAVLRHAPCSVEVVRRPYPDRNLSDGMRVLIPTDGSEHADYALHTVAQRPWPPRSEFRVVASPEYPVLIGEYPYYAPEQLAELTRGSREHAVHSALAGEKFLVDAGFAATQRLIEPLDTPANAILRAAEHWLPDLIVMGSHGRRGFDRLVMGSVSEKIALYAACSVEVVRRPLPVL